jgi:hypothetical protein
MAGGGETRKRASEAILAERDNRAVQMRVQRYTLQHISDTLGYSGASHVAQRIKAVLAARQAELFANADTLVAEQLAEIDELATAAWGVLQRDHYVVNSGALIDGPDGALLKDDGPILQSIDRLARLLERKAKLLGIDKPEKTEGALTVRIEGMDGESGP